MYNQKKYDIFMKETVNMRLEFLSGKKNSEKVSEVLSSKFRDLNMIILDQTNKIGTLKYTIQYQRNISTTEQTKQHRKRRQPTQDFRLMQKFIYG